MASLNQYSIGQAIQLLTGSKTVDKPFHFFNINGEAPLTTDPYRAHFYAICILTSGSLTATANLRTYKIRNGQLFAIAPGHIHSFQEISNDLAARVFYFNRDFLDTVRNDNSVLINHPFIKTGASPVVSLTHEEQDRISSVINLFEKYANQNPDNSLTTKYLFLSGLLDVGYIYKKNYNNSLSTGSRPADLVNRYLHMVSEKYLIKKKVSDYAAQLSISTKHLSETVKAITGKPAGAWIDEMILQEAKVLLKQSTYTIAEIAHYLHFSDQSAFGKFFRSKTGYSPGYFREMQ